MDSDILTILGRRARAVASSNPPGDLIVPLFLGSALEEAHNDHGHVIATDASSFRVGSQTVVHHVLADLIQLLPRGNTAPDKLDDGL